MDNGSSEILRWDLPSRFRWLGIIDAALQEIGQEFEWAPELLNQISIAAIEAVSNAIEHGNRFDSEQRVRVELRVEDGRFIFSVSDSGPGFNRSRLTTVPPAPDDPAFFGARGRGIFIMREIMDAVRTHKDDEGRFVIELEKTLQSTERTGD